MSELQQVLEGKNQPQPSAVAPEEPLVDLDLSYVNSPVNKKRAISIINTIAKYSPTGKELLEQAAKDGYHLLMIGAGGWAGQVDEEHKYLFLNSCETDNYLIETMAHECRHIQQFSRGVDVGCSMYNIKDAIRLHRCKEADAEATAAAVCHEIRVNSGIDGPWKEFAAERPAITGGFEAACTDKNDPNVSHAMYQGAFNGWFQEEKLVKIYEDNYIVAGALVECFDRGKNPEDFFHKKSTSAQIVSMVCADGKGGCYWEEKPDVLNEPYHLLISQQTVDRADSILKGIENNTGVKQDYSYRDMPRREDWNKAEKQNAPIQQDNTPQAPVKAAIAKAVASFKSR